MISDKETIQILRKQLDKKNKQLEAERALWKSDSTIRRLNKTVVLHVAQTRGTRQHMHIKITTCEETGKEFRWYQHQVPFPKCKQTD